MKPFSRTLLPCSIAILAAFAPFGAAGQTGWVSRGPDGVAAVSDLAFDDSAAYAATSNGVFRSVDGGETWTQSGLRGITVAWVVASPGAATVLTTVQDVVEGVSRLYASRDHGLTWAPVLGIPSAARPSIDRSDPSRIVVEGPNDSIWRSIDSGVSWQPIGKIPVSAGTLTSDSPALYVAAAGNDRFQLFRSANEGASWSDVTPPEISTSITAYAVGDAAIYAGAPGSFCRSTDSGATWTCSSFPQYPTKILEIREPGGQSAPRLIALSLDHVYVSDDLGATWSPATEINAPTGSGSVAAAPSAPIALLGTPRGILRSADGGLSWARAGAGLRASAVQSLATDPRHPSTLWIDTGSFADSQSDLFRSSDAGGSWSPVSGPPASLLPRTLVVDPSDSSTLFAGSQALYRSEDAGGSWTAVPSLPESYVETVAADQATGAVWAGSSQGLFRSDDHGQSWSGPAFAQEVYTLLFDGKSPDRAYAGSFFDIEAGFYGYPEGGSIFVSLNGGGSFSRSPHEFGSAVTAIAADPFDDRRLYVGTYNGVSRTADGGASWHDSALASTFFGRVNALVADPVRDGHLYAATDSGVYRSTDHAETWHAFSSGLGLLGGNALLITPDGGALRVGTNGGGVFELDLEGDAPSLPCEPTPNRLCLVGGRYAVELSGSLPNAGEPHAAAASPLSDRSGFFGFPFATGDPSLPEVVVKMLGEQASGAPGAQIFYSSLTTLPWTLTVSDTLTGQSQVYHNDSVAPFCGDAPRAFAALEAAAERRQPAAATADESLLLLGGRFSVTLTARRSSGEAVAVHAIPETDRFGYFSFPSVVGDPSFPEVVVKMIDFRAVSGKFWVFQTGLTPLDYTLTVTDTTSGDQRVYDNPAPFCGSADTNAFPTSSPSD